MLRSYFYSPLSTWMSGLCEQEYKQIKTKYEVIQNTLAYRIVAYNIAPSVTFKYRENDFCYQVCPGKSIEISNITLYSVQLQEDLLLSRETKSCVHFYLPKEWRNIASSRLLCSPEITLLQQYLLFKVFNEIFVDLHAKILHRCLAVRQYNRRGVVWELPFRFCVAGRHGALSQCQNLLFSFKS